MGVDDVQRLPVGPQLVEPRRAVRLRRRDPRATPTTVWRCSGSTRSPSPGSAWAPTARTSRRCTRSPRRCGRSPGSPARRWRSRPRRSSVPPDLLAYLGQGEHHGKVSDLAYHNSLMVQIWSMLASQGRPARRPRAPAAPPAPGTTAWITYVRCHDDIGWAIADEDAAAVGLSGFAHRRFLSDFYAGDFPGSWAQGLVFQENPRPATGGSPGRSPPWPGWGRRPPGSSAGSCSPTRWSSGTAGSRSSGWATRSGCSTTRTGTPSPSTPTTTGGCTGRPDAVAAARGHPRDPRGPCVALVAARAALPHLHASVPAEVLDPRDPGVLLVAGDTRSARCSAPTTSRPSPGMCPVTCWPVSAWTPATVDRISGDRPHRARRGGPARALRGALAHRQLVEQLEAVLVVPLLADLGEPEGRIMASDATLSG